MELSKALEKAKVKISRKSFKIANAILKTNDELNEMAKKLQPILKAEKEVVKSVIINVLTQ